MLSPARSVAPIGTSGGSPDQEPAPHPALLRGLSYASPPFIKIDDSKSATLSLSDQTRLCVGLIKGIISMTEKTATNADRRNVASGLRLLSRSTYDAALNINREQLRRAAEESLEAAMSRIDQSNLSHMHNVSIFTAAPHHPPGTHVVAATSWQTISLPESWDSSNKRKAVESPSSPSAPKLRRPNPPSSDSPLSSVSESSSEDIVSEHGSGSDSISIPDPSYEYPHAASSDAAFSSLRSYDADVSDNGRSNRMTPSSWSANSHDGMTGKEDGAAERRRTRKYLEKWRVIVHTARHERSMIDDEEISPAKTKPEV